MQNLLSAFSNPVRLKLILCLANGKKNVHELIENCGLSQSAISQHLSKLKAVDLVHAVHEGKFVYYSLRNKKIGDVAKTLYEFISQY